MTGLQWSETIVLDKQPDTFPLVRWIRMAGTQREIGRKMAQIAKNRYGVALAKNEFSDYGRARYARLGTNNPALLERARGLLDAYVLRRMIQR